MTGLYGYATTASSGNSIVWWGDVFGYLWVDAPVDIALNAGYNGA